MVDVTELFNAHHPDLLRYLTRLSGDPDVAADAARETFVRLLDRAPSGTIERGWLFRVATNLTFDDARMRTRRLDITGRQTESIPAATAAPNPLELMEAAERQAAVSRALATLTPKERTALLMREEGFSHREIAEAVATTTGSVGTLLARALQRLAERLPLDHQQP